MYKFGIAVAIAATTAAHAAFAADLPRKNTPPVLVAAPLAFSWTGAYLGVNLGYVQTGDKSAARAANPDDDFAVDEVVVLGAERTRLKSSGFTGGGQFGYNYQVTPGSGLVLGVETDLQYTDAKRRRIVGRTFSGPSQALPNTTLTIALSNNQSDQLDFLGTFRGRVGYAFDRVLIYGTGGLA